MRELVCYRCGRTALLPDRKRCECGEPLWFDTDEQASDFAWPGTDSDSAGESAGTGIWRYADLLPVASPGRAPRSERTGDRAAARGGAVAGVGAAAGATPLVRTPALDDDAGCRLWLKDERANPTGSFKDRGSAVGVAWAARHDREWVGTVSHGNMAVSMAANAAGTGGVGGSGEADGDESGADGPTAVVLVPNDIADERLAAIAQFGPEVLRVAGDYGNLYRESLAAETPVEFVNSDTPLRVAGQKTTALEICEAFLSDDGVGRTTSSAPDAIVLPVSSGGHASAAWKALRELRRAGLLAESEMPRLYLVQAAACDPIAAAFREEAEEVTPASETESTVAYSIANPDPPSGTRALAAARETGGEVLSVSDDEILAAKERLAREAGFGVEPASATTLAGVRRLSEAGKIAERDEVVAVLTGRGFASGTVPDAKPETVALEDVAGKLAELTE